MAPFWIAVLAVSAAVVQANSENIQLHKDDWRNKIKNVVILVEENRSFDTFAGGLTYNHAIDGLVNHNYCNSM